MTALVFNCAFNGLGVIRALGRHGATVFALDSKRSTGTYSRYATFVECPDPLVAETAFVDFLVKLAPRFKERPILIPTNDEWAAAVSRSKDRLKAHYHVCVADWPVVEMVLRKARFYAWAAQRNYPVPATWSSKALSDIPATAFPIIAKPEMRRNATDEVETARLTRILYQLRMTVIEDQAQLRAFLEKHRDLLDHFLFQEYVRGLSDCMFTIGVYADRDYIVRALFSGRKVRGFPPDSGDCMVGRTEPVPEAVRQIVRDLCKEIRYHGLAEFEFKRDLKTGRYRLIEINPRTWSWVGITPAAGVNLPWIACSDLSGRGIPAYVEGVTSGVTWLRVADDLLNCLEGNRKLGFPEWNYSLLAWWRSVRNHKMVSAEFSWTDPRPAFVHWKPMIKRIVTTVLKSPFRRERGRPAPTAEALGAARTSYNLHV
jgi:D-aspartate ligase